LNPRAYELAATQTFSITEYRKEGGDTFGLSQPSFEGPEDLKDTVLYYLNHPEAREDCAVDALRRVQGHTFDDRTMQVMSHLELFDKGKELNASKVSR
jgi:spore maturation protein CgeB